MVARLYTVSGIEKVKGVLEQLSRVVLNTLDSIVVTGEWQPDEFNSHRNDDDPEPTREFVLDNFVIVPQPGLVFTAVDKKTRDLVFVRANDDIISIIVSRNKDKA